MGTYQVPEMNFTVTNTFAMLSYEGIPTAFIHQAKQYLVNTPDGYAFGMGVASFEPDTPFAAFSYYYSASEFYLLNLQLTDNLLATLSKHDWELEYVVAALTTLVTARNYPLGVPMPDHIVLYGGVGHCEALLNAFKTHLNTHVGRDIYNNPVIMTSDLIALHIVMELNTILEDNPEYRIQAVSDRCLRVLNASNKEVANFTRNDAHSTYWVDHTVGIVSVIMTLANGDSHYLRLDDLRADYLVAEFQRSKV